ncbi:MAG: aldose 1-epimerase family protein [Anaerobutyricum sp.]|nr:aldose 1-epimerase family protein [Anaerobutyricum sp.]
MEYKLSNGQLEVIFQTTGAALHSIKDSEGTEYLWQGDANYWSGQAPILFPICGSIRNDQAILPNGEKTTMPRHGIVRKKEFAFVEKTEDSITFEIVSDQEMYKQFPYDFKLCIKYTLEENAVRTTFIVENQDKKEMPFFVGGHPGFRCPVFEGEEYHDYYLKFEKEETCTVPYPVSETGLIDIEKRTVFLNSQNKLPLSHSLFAKDAVILDELKSRKVQLCSKNHGELLEIEFDDFPYLILWSSSNEGPFIALEPWLGLSTCNDEDDEFVKKRNIQKVMPKQIKKYSFLIKILK